MNLASQSLPGGLAGLGFIDYLASLWRFRSLFYQLVRRDIAIRYRQTLLGIAWALFQPLISMGIISFFVGRVFQTGNGTTSYPAFVFVGLLPWIFFSKATSGASYSLVGNAAVVTRAAFPRVLVPLANVGMHFLDLMLTIAVIFPVAAFTKTSVPLTHLWILVPALVWLVFLTVGVSLLLATSYVFFRDTGYALQLGLNLALFASPVMYPLSQVPPSLQQWVCLNPLVGIIELFRMACFKTQVSVSCIYLGLFTTALSFLVGWFTFRRYEGRFADYV